MLVFNFLVYALLITVVSWKLRFAGIGNRFYDDFMSMESIEKLRGFSAIMILLFFISCKQAFIDYSLLQIFRSMGPSFAVIFCSCFVYGFTKSPDTKLSFLRNSIDCRGKQLRDWYKKRYGLKLFLFVAAFIGNCVVFRLLPGNIFLRILEQLLRSCLILILIFGIRMKVRIDNPIIRFMSKYSFGVILMSLLFIPLFSFLIWRDGKAYFEMFGYNLAVFAVAVTSFSALFGMAADKILGVVLSLFVRKESEIPVASSQETE